MIEVPLGNGGVTTIDNTDWDLVSQYTWYKETMDDVSYARTSVNGQTIRMHSLLYPAPKGLETDHKDMNGLNNQRRNLRFCTRQQNSANKPKRVGTSSRYKGVSWNINRNHWNSLIKVNYKVINLGTYRDEVEAAKAYDRAAIFYFGDYARINFPREDY